MRLYWPKPARWTENGRHPLQDELKRQARRRSTPSPRRPSPVTPDNFVRAESDLYFADLVKDGGLREILPSPRAGGDRQPDGHPPQPRHALFRGRLRSRCRTGDDHAAGAGKRFMSMQVINEDHYMPEVVYGAGSLHA